MTYPPGSPGYPPAQSPGGYGASSTPSFTKSDDGESNLKLYLTIAVVALGLASYLLSYGPMITRMLPNGDEVVESGSTLPIDLALLAALLAGVSLLPKAKNYAAVVAAVAVLGALLLIEDTFGASGRGWALWFALGCGVIQAILAVSALLLDAGVITPPAPRPKYDQYGQYGQYGGYYGQQVPTSHLSSPDTAPNTAATRRGRRPAASARSARSLDPSSLAVRTAARSPQQQGSPTPPTGFPSFSPPPSSGSGGPGQGKLRKPRRFRPGPALVWPGSAAAGAVLAVGPVTVLTVRTRARRVAGEGT